MTLIHPSEYEASLVKVAKINLRAAKKGFDGRVTLTGTYVTRTRTVEGGLSVTEQMVEATLGGVAPSYNGWSLLAVLEWDSQAGLITRTVPGFDGVIDRSTLVPEWCAHCKTTRFRSKVYLVVNETGETVQVGSTCIKDFLGWTGTLAFLPTTSELETEFGWGSDSYSDPVFSTETVLAVAWAAIKAFGFTPASGPSPTRGDVTVYLMGRRDKHNAHLFDEMAPYVGSSLDEAKTVREFVLSEEFSGYSEYVVNLKAAAAAEWATPRTFGLLVSAPQAYARHLDQSLIRKARAALGAGSVHVGAVKERLRHLELTFQNGRYLESEWGTTTLLTFTDEAGNVFKWFRSGTWEYEPNTQLVITATVKKHDEYAGVKQTVITRGVVESETVPAPAGSATMEVQREETPCSS